MIDFADISYLKTGNERQKQAYQTLTAHQIFEKLAAFDPLLTGTIPIRIDIASSDLDIVCYWTNKAEFRSAVELAFANTNGFQLQEVFMNGQETILANFIIDGFEIEIFGQNIPSRQQNAFRHLLIEHQLLTEKGEVFRQEVIKLKLQGYKTEPAFAQLLKLEGDPYEALLNLTE